MSSTGSSGRASPNSSASDSEEEAELAEAEARRRAAWFGTVDRRIADKEAAGFDWDEDAPIDTAAHTEAEHPVPPEEFSAALGGRFEGARPGFLFKTGPNGLGYYWDRPPAAADTPLVGPVPTGGSGSSELFSYIDASKAAVAASSGGGGGGGGGGGDGEGLRLASLDRMEDGLLGTGAQSEVRLYRDPSPPPGFIGELMYGVKVIRKAGLSQRAAARVMEEKAALTAATADWAATSRARPGPIVRLFGTDQDESALYFIMEFLSKGTLTQICPLPPSLARYYVAALAHAVETCHRLGFIHRDVKLDNVLLDGDAVLRLVDFGLCRRLRRQSDERATTLLGTLGCVAPEVLAAQPYHHAADWWSVGVAAHHLLLGAPPFDPFADPMAGDWADAENASVLERWVERLTAPSNLEATLRSSCARICRAVEEEQEGEDTRPSCGGASAAEELVRGLLAPAPAGRMATQGGLAELKRARWFEGFDWAALEAGTLLPPEQAFSFRLPAAAPAAAGGQGGAGGSGFAGF